MMDYNRIENKQKLYFENKDKISDTALLKYETAFAIEYTHNSTAIEGNTLTLMETKLLLDDEISVGGKNLKEIYEIINHKKAFDYVKKCVEEKLPLSEKITKDIHSIVNENIFVGGIYRNEPVYISGARHKPPVGMKMYEQIKNFFVDLNFKNELNPIELAAFTHAEFVRIHPFIDGNGRTSRLIMNYQLMINGFVPISIDAKDRLKYYDCLEEYALTADITKFANMVAELVEKRLDEYLEMI